MTLELASPDTCFHATSREACFVALKTWRASSLPNLTIASAVATLCDPLTRTSAPHRQVFAQLSVLNMFTLISALYAETHRFRNSLVQQQPHGSPLAVALQQWKDFWPSHVRDEELAGLSATRDSPVGFIRHAPEYWLFTHLVLERRVEQSVGTYTADIACEDGDMMRTRAIMAELQRSGVPEIQ